MGINATTLINSAHNMIARWGGVGQLIRDGDERDATMAITDYSWSERQTIAADNAVKIRVSAKDLDIPPDEMLDLVQFQGALYKIIAKPRSPRPQNTAIYYDLDCLWIENVT
jgi:hypothetical protein